MENIWTKFTKEIGYATSSIQYIELASRIAYKNEIENIKDGKIIELAKEYGLSLSCFPEDITSCIASNYIIHIQSCVESFLMDFKGLVGSPVYLKDDYNPEKTNRLKWTIDHAQIAQTDEVKDLYNICNYYRLLRNKFVHPGKQSQDLKNAYSLLRNFEKGKLKALADIDTVCFDDQVLFSRSARRLLKIIFKESKYNWNVIIENERDNIKRFTKSYPKDINRKQSHVINYIRRYYPVPKEDISKYL